MTIYHKHHVVPKHAGGSNAPGNMTCPLTIEEHAEHHHYRYEMLGEWQDKLAWLTLSSQITKDAARRMAVSLALRGKSKSKEQRAKMSSSIKRAWVIRGGSPTTGLKLGPCSEVRKQRISAAHLGRIRPKSPCIHCAMIVSGAMMARWHGANCKSFPAHQSTLL